MGANTTGARNIAIGYGAMNDTDAGSTSLASQDNIFIGLDAGGGTWADAASNYNVAIGNYAMDDALNGALYNMAMGYNALGALTSGDSNVAVGHGAGSALTTGGSNILIGRGAGDAGRRAQKSEHHSDFSAVSYTHLRAHET